MTGDKVLTPKLVLKSQRKLNTSLNFAVPNRDLEA